MSQPSQHKLLIEGVSTVIPKAASVSDLTAAVSSLQQIMKVEREARLAVTLDELWFVIANESRRILQARQIFVLEATAKGNLMRAVSSLSRVDRDSPTIRWLERVSRDMVNVLEADACIEMQISMLPSGQDEQAALFPFPIILLCALRSRTGQDIAYIMAAREATFGEAQRASAKRLTESFEHAAEALGAVKRKSMRLTRRRIGVISAVFSVAALAVVPVPLTVLAPAEVIAQEAFVVTAPIEGTIGQIPVDAGHMVKTGDVIVRLVDTAQRNQLEIAEQEVGVAEAKWRQISLAAFSDPTSRRELSVVTSEKTLKQAERDYARDLLARTVIRAEREGVAIYADKRELVGRPVQTGQRLMDIADPSKIRIRAQAPLDDAMALQVGGHVRFFPDADPLNPVDATVVETGHQARPTESGSLAFRVDADMPASATERLRIGHRGTAQIFGANVSLGFYLLRRPLSAFRQKFGL
jgi:multidrug resistance efflux pump